MRLAVKEWVVVLWGNYGGWARSKYVVIVVYREVWKCKICIFGCGDRSRTE